jgi:hypothetical protein
VVHTSVHTTPCVCSGPRFTVSGVIRYHGDATITQSTVVVTGDCIIESAGDPLPGPDPSWTGRLSNLAPTADVVEGAAWLRLSDGRECEIEITRAVAGSGLIEFSGAAGILDLR